MADTSSSVAAAREKVRAVAPKLMDLTEQVLFGDVWERPGLSKRDRSLITVAVLLATYRPEQLRGHLQRALDNGVTQGDARRNWGTDHPPGLLLWVASVGDGRHRRP
jgi:4-carboxymuconolactone decarboxylase